jgi:hypothetical protein
MQQAEVMREIIDGGRDVYAYFNNTAGDAFGNAVSLKGMVG